RPGLVPAGPGPRRAAQVTFRRTPLPVLYLPLASEDRTPSPRPAAVPPRRTREMSGFARVRQPARRAAAYARGGPGAGKSDLSGSEPQIGHRLCAIR